MPPKVIEQIAFFEGSSVFARWPAHVQSMAVAMIESPIEALRRACILRQVSCEGSRRELILRICEQHSTYCRPMGLQVSPSLADDGIASQSVIVDTTASYNTS